VPTQALDIRDTATLRAGRMAVIFERRGDRIAHRVVYSADGDNEQLLLESIEGQPDESWPASPPLQEGRIESTGGRDVAMLIGMAGKSHWSVSIEADAEHESLTFDVACRVKEPGGRLASSYRIGDTQNVRLASVENCRKVEQPNQLVLESELHADVPATVRWKYIVTM